MNTPDNKFIGHDGFIWFVGRCEDRNDPLSLGRIRIRIFGTHPDDTTLVPATSLPWAMPIQPITSAGAYGVGSTPVGPIPGSHVFGFWADSNDKQIPMFMGVISGGTGQFSFGQSIGNAITDVTNAVGSATKAIENFIVPPGNTSTLGKAVSLAKILKSKYG